MAKQDGSKNIQQQTTNQKTSKLFPCRFEGCNALFKKLSHLSRHELIHNDIRPFQCTFEGCDKAYRSSAHLKRHEVSHTGEKQYRCEFEGCDVSCFTLWNLKRHVKRTHKNSFQCPTCNEEFKKKKLLQDHISLEHKRSIVACSFPGCAQVFKNSAKMRHHQKVHSGKAYVCTVKDCNKRFALWSECRQHTAECKENVQRNCDVCGKTFSTRSNLKAHKKVHDGEREVFVCQYENCGRYYTKKSNLKVHVQSYHLNVRPFECPKSECSKSFTYKHLLRKHLDWHAKKDDKPNDTKSVRRKRPKRMVTSDLSAITGYIPELWTKMTPAEVNAYVNENPSMYDHPEAMEDTDIIPHDYETTQAELTPMTSGDFSSSILKSTAVDTTEEDGQSVRSCYTEHTNQTAASAEVGIDDSSEDTLTARTSDMEFEDDELGMILEPSTLEEASLFLDRINQGKKHASSSNNSSRSSSVCGNNGVNEGMKLLKQFVVNQHQQKDPLLEKRPTSPMETCRMQSHTSRTDSDSSDNERNLLCA